MKLKPYKFILKRIGILWFGIMITDLLGVHYIDTTDEYPDLCAVFFFEDVRPVMGPDWRDNKPYNMTGISCEALDAALEEQLGSE
jgi:hypothetical protein